LIFFEKPISACFMTICIVLILAQLLFGLTGYLRKKRDGAMLG
jgi:hypothetical protein